MSTTKITFAILTALSINACSKTSEDEDTSASTTDTNGLAAVTDVGELKLSSLQIDLPAALKANASGLRLLAGKRSMDACQMGQTIKEVTSRVGEVANFACHIEAEKANFQFGKKIKLIAGGQEFGRLWVVKDGDKITFNMCQSGEHTSRQVIEISKVTSAGPAGSIYSIGSDGDQSYSTGLTFDFSVENISSIDSTDINQNGENKFARTVKLSINKTGVSSASLASKGTWEGNSFQQRGAAKLGTEYGASLFQNSGTFQDQTFTFSGRSYFNAVGEVVADSATQDFLASGTLYVAAADVPSFLAEDASVSLPEGWVKSDCPDTEVDLELNPESEAHQACNDNQDYEYACRNSESFEQGTETNDL